MREAIPEQVILARLAQSEQMREFFIQVWSQNPGLAAQGGDRVRSLMTELALPEPETRSQETTAPNAASVSPNVSSLP